MSADVFMAIADPTRRRLLDLLARGDSDVGTLAGRFNCSLPAVSQHLKKLRDAKLVTVKAEGNRRLYRLRASPLKAVHDWTTAYQAFWTAKLDALAAHLEKNP
jgi:DNA-binding transcriptional ArsR family regulator